jgi:hypothetical protein
MPGEKKQMFYQCEGQNKKNMLVNFGEELKEGIHRIGNQPG